MAGLDKDADGKPVFAKGVMSGKIIGYSPLGVQMYNGGYYSNHSEYHVPTYEVKKSILGELKQIVGVLYQANGEPVRFEALSADLQMSEYADPHEVVVTIRLKKDPETGQLYRLIKEEPDSLF